MANNSKNKTTTGQKVDRALSTFERIFDTATRGTDRLGR